MSRLISLFKSNEDGVLKRRSSLSKIKAPLTRLTQMFSHKQISSFVLTGFKKTFVSSNNSVKPIQNARCSVYSLSDTQDYAQSTTDTASRHIL